jgi:type I restriction enzyme S subunit
MTTVGNPKALINFLLGLGRGQGPSYVEGESQIRAINQKCVRNGVVDVTHARAHNPLGFIKDFAFLQDGDVCINSTGTGTIGRVGLWAQTPNETDRFFADSHVTIARPNAALVNPHYLAAVLQSPAVQAAIETYCFSGSTNQVELNKTGLSELEICLLSRDEQNAVAEVIVCIDSGIEQTEALIAKQLRIKTGLMRDLLTKGIDECGNIRSEATHAFKDSPLGRIPEEWDVAPLAKAADLRVGYAFKGSWFSASGVRLLRGENVGTGALNWKDTACLPLDIAKEFEDYSLVVGDLVIGMDRTFTKQGFKVSTVTENDLPCLLVQRVGCFVPIEIPKQFMRLLIISPHYQRELLLLQKGMDIPHLSKSEILAPLVPLPREKTEMIEIAKRVDAIEFYVKNCQDSLKKYTALKRGIMHDLLTGERQVMPLLAQAAQQ